MKYISTERFERVDPKLLQAGDKFTFDSCFTASGVHEMYLMTVAGVADGTVSYVSPTGLKMDADLGAYSYYRLRPEGSVESDIARLVRLRGEVQAKQDDVDSMMNHFKLVPGDVVARQFLDFMEGK